MTERKVDELAKLSAELQDAIASTSALREALAAAMVAGEEESASRRAAVSLLEDAIAARRALAEVFAQRALVLAYADRVRGSADVTAIVTAATEMLGRHLRASRVICAEAVGDGLRTLASYVDVAAGGAEGLGVLSGATLSDLRIGLPLVVHDVAKDPRFGEAARGDHRAAEIAAYVVVPWTTGERWHGVLMVQSALARTWSIGEIALIVELAERTAADVGRARAEAALRESEARFRALVRATSDVVYRARGDWSEVRVLSEPGSATRSSAATGPFADVSERERLDEAIEASVRKRSNLDVELRTRREGQEVGWLDARAVPMLDDRGEVLEWFGAVTDITARKALEQAATDANLAKDEFLSTLGHELRTPLAAILLWAGALHSGTVTVEQLARAVAAIIESAKGMGYLVDDLLDLSRMAGGQLVLAPRPVDVARVVRATCGVFQPTMAAKKITFEVDVDDPGVALLDEARFQQMLWNLLSNAAKFTGEGGHVGVRVRRDGGVLETEVRDDGEGIAPELVDRVFERFREVEGGGPRLHGGLGIGLALSQLAALHGGQISAESEGLGRGACFRIRLPWVDGALPVAEPLPSEAADLHGVDVVVVEDDPPTRGAMEWTLARAGARVIAVPSSEAALVALGSLECASGRVTVIVSDLALPGAGGIELIERVVAAFGARGHRAPPACAISAHAQEVDRQRAIDAGFDMFVAKPVTPARLVAIVRDLRDIAADAATSP